MHFKIIVLLLLISQGISFGQTNKENNSSKLKYTYNKLFNSYDTLYIQRSSTDYAFTLNNKNWMDVYQLKIADESLGLKSDLSYNVGASIGYKMFAIGYSVNINDLVTVQAIKSKEMNMNLTNNLFSLEMSYLNNQGQTKVSGYQKDTVFLAMNEQFKGLDTKIYGADLYYFINHNKYSNAAAYSDIPNYTQFKSAGSIVIGFSFSSERLYFDLSELPVRDQLYNLKNTNVQSYAYNTYCMNLGYSYNFVFSKHWLANLTVIPSFGVRVDSEINNKAINFTMKNKVRIALIQDLNKYFWGIKCQYSSHKYNKNNNSASTSIGNFNVLIGIKFK